MAEGKHGNYSSQNTCNQGGTFGTDTCTQVNTAARVLASGAYNIGSRTVRLIDCGASRTPSCIYYGSGRQECFWTVSNFRGWIPTSVGGAESSDDSSRLQAEGF